MHNRMVAPPMLPGNRGVKVADEAVKQRLERRLVVSAEIVEDLLHHLAVHLVVGGDLFHE